MNRFDEIRKNYPGLQNQVYLDTATTGLLSKATYDAMRKQLDARYYQGVSIKEYYDSWALADSLREKVAKLLGADEDEVFYGKDSSDMINALTLNIDIQEGANVIIPDMSFPSTRNAWLAREKDGLEVRYAISKLGEISTDALLALADESTLAISLCLVEPSSGFRYDIATIGEFCNKNNILLVVDATQCLSAVNIYVHEMYIDFLVASTYKWMTNVFGLGVGYMSKNLLKTVHSSVVGWVGAKDRIGDFDKLTYEESETAKRFETGGLNWIGIFGLEKAIDGYMALGKKEVENYILGLTDYVYDKIQQLEGFSIVKPFKFVNRSNIIYLKIPESMKLNDGILIENGMRAHVASKDTIRIGLHYYNNRQDIDQFLDFLEKYHQ
jgi:selenocysteine lyase/cysteine desulfurase